MFRFFSNLSNRAVLLILLAVGLSSSVASFVVNLVNNVDTSPGWWTSWLQNFSTEMFGAFLTFILFELIVGNREKQRDEERTLKRERENFEKMIEQDKALKAQMIEIETARRSEILEQEKEQLIRRMRSSINGETIRAIEELRAHGWLTDGSLQGSNFAWANLRGGKLGWANLQGVNLHFVDLQDAQLAWVKLQGATLNNANLQAAALSLAVFDTNTILPDGNNWTPETDMSRYTDPTHPQFWRSDNLNSPAYRGKNT